MFNNEELANFMTFDDMVIPTDKIDSKVIKLVEDWYVMSTRKKNSSDICALVKDDGKNYLQIFKPEDIAMIIFSKKFDNYIKSPANVDRLFNIDDNNVFFNVFDTIKATEPNNRSFGRFKDTNISKDIEFDGIVIRHFNWEASSAYLFINCINYFELSYKDFISKSFSDKGKKASTVHYRIMNFLRDLSIHSLKEIISEDY